MIIGLGYKARSGKDTVADYLVKNHNFKRIAFADALKEACRQIFSLTDEQLFGNLKEVVDPYWGLTPRYILQKVGTECMREVFDKDIWVKAVERRVSTANNNWVITDMRFPNEAQAVLNWGGYAVRVDRNGAGVAPITKTWLWGLIKRNKQHPSESAMNSFKQWDYVLENHSANLEELYINIEKMLKDLRETR